MLLGELQNFGRDASTDSFAQLERDFAESGESGSDFYHVRNMLDKESYLLQGYLFKQANFRIKGWKQRWFVLDSTKHQLRYFDTRDDFRDKGYIDLSEVNGLAETPAGGIVVSAGAPKKSEDGCFFELHTEKRTYFFCAESRSAAREWIQKRQSCLSNE